MNEETNEAHEFYDCIVLSFPFVKIYFMVQTIF